ncbi:hypothetical protein C8R47DRAFT_1082925 [Mycena vitilis]|nr:hypothetical protein C8R47DRAFT_1082925 [Mycena vitilis]
MPTWNSYLSSHPELTPTGVPYSKCGLSPVRPTRTRSNSTLPTSPNLRQDDVSPSRERGFLAGTPPPPSAKRRVPPLLLFAGVDGVPRRRRAAAPTSKFNFWAPRERGFAARHGRLALQFAECGCSAELGAGGGGAAPTSTFYLSFPRARVRCEFSAPDVPPQRSESKFDFQVPASGPSARPQFQKLRLRRHGIESDAPHKQNPHFSRPRAHLGLARWLGVGLRFVGLGDFSGRGRGAYLDFFWPAARCVACQSQCAGGVLEDFNLMFLRLRRVLWSLKNGHFDLVEVL